MAADRGSGGREAARGPRPAMRLMLVHRSKRRHQPEFGKIDAYQKASAMPRERSECVSALAIRSFATIGLSGLVLLAMFAGCAMGQTQTGQPQPAPPKAGQAKTNRVKTNQAKTGQTKTNQVKAAPARTAQPPRVAPAAPSPNASEEQRRKSNENVITIMGSGRLTGYTQFAEDISSVFDEMPGSNVRVISMLGRGAGQNVLDMLYLKSIDMGIVDQDILTYLKRKDPALYGDVDQRIQYIAKLFNTALHVYAKKDIDSLEDLRGKKVSCLKAMSTVAVLCENLFLALGIEAQIVYDDPALAMQKVKSGEVAAAARGGQPPLIGFESVDPEDNLHFVPIDEKSLPNSNFGAIRSTYLPARLRSSYYPAMIPEGVDVPTVATSSMLAAYSWPAGSERSLRLAGFVKAFFDNIDKFPKSPRHPAWADVILTADVPGWKRLPAAQELVDKMRLTAQNQPGGDRSAFVDERARIAFADFVDQYSKTRGSPIPLSDDEKSVLWLQFRQWWTERGSR